MKLLVFFIFLVITQPCFSSWTLVNYASSVNYFGSKENKIEVSSFSNMEGSISDQGQFRVTIDLSSIETNNSKRNLLIQDVLLETDSFQEAILYFDLGNDFLNNKPLNKSTKIDVSTNFMLHGVAQKVDMTILLVRLKNDFLLIKTYEPVILKLADYDLTTGLEKLKKAEPSNSIGNFVPVSINMFFRRIHPD